MKMPPCHRMDTAREWFGYRWWLLRVWYPGRLRWHMKETLPWKLAMLLPRKVAYLAFFRVYGVLGYIGRDFEAVCREWERRGR